MKALKVRYYAFIAIGIIAFITNFTIQSGYQSTYRESVISCFGNIFVLTALILWAIGITGLMQIANKDKQPQKNTRPRSSVETKEELEKWLNEEK